MFVVCGEALWDLFALDGRDGLQFDARVGGSPLNVAVGLARLGQPVALLTGLSTDRLGQRLTGTLDAEGVRTDFLKRVARPTTLSVVDVEPDGQPIYAFYGAEAADRSIRTEDLPRLGPDVWGIHAGSFSLVVEPVGSALLALFARERGRRLLTLDPNVRLNVEADTGLWRSRIDRLVRCSDLVKVSDEDLGLLYPGAITQEIAADWLRAGVGLVVITRGASGAEAHTDAGRIAVPGRTVRVADTVGAGDAFQAALIAGLAERGARTRNELDALAPSQIVEVVCFAVAAAAITCTRRGADFPRRAELGGP